MKIIIGADLVPTKSNIKIFESGMSEKLVSRGLLERLNKTDVRIFNLETPLTDALSPIEKCGPCLSASTKCVNGIKSLGANPFDPLETPDHIAELKSRCDYVIVLYHGGKEYYRCPSPNLRKVFR